MWRRRFRHQILSNATWCCVHMMNQLLRQIICQPRPGFLGTSTICKRKVSVSHQSDVICLTVGWLADASQTLEYGKNYEGYWTGELFVKQVGHNTLIMKIC